MDPEGIHLEAPMDPFWIHLDSAAMPYISTLLLDTQMTLLIKLQAPTTLESLTPTAVKSRAT